MTASRSLGRVRGAPVALLLLVAAVPGAAQAPQPVPACSADSTYHRLDFWVGDWRVTVHDTLDGTDHITRILHGCAIHEAWHDAVPGRDGESLFFVSPGQQRWKQVWITENARATGGTKEKSMIAWYPDGGVRFQGELTGRLGRLLLDRTTLTPRPDGTVQQVIELSTDGGSTWQETYRAVYTRIKP